MTDIELGPPYCVKWICKRCLLDGQMIAALTNEPSSRSGGALSAEQA
jgi:hypothetical protein